MCDTLLDEEASGSETESEQEEQGDGDAKISKETAAAALNTVFQYVESQQVDGSHNTAGATDLDELKKLVASLIENADASDTERDEMQEAWDADIPMGMRD